MSDGPTFLSTPPEAVPDREERPIVVPPPSPPPYRSPGKVRFEPEVALPRQRRIPEPVEEVPTAGDSAGEHHTMERGRYNAFTYVAVAFAFEAVMFAAVPYWVLGALLRPMTSDWRISGGAALAIGVVLAWRVFSDRWRCIEAFSSRFCSGLANLSILYVPFVAFVYANVRGIMKLQRR